MPIRNVGFPSPEMVAKLGWPYETDLDMAFLLDSIVGIVVGRMARWKSLNQRPVGR